MPPPAAAAAAAGDEDGENGENGENGEDGEDGENGDREEEEEEEPPTPNPPNPPRLPRARERFKEARAALRRACGYHSTNTWCRSVRRAAWGSSRTSQTDNMEEKETPTPSEVKADEEKAVRSGCGCRSGCRSGFGKVVVS